MLEKTVKEIAEWEAELGNARQDESTAKDEVRVAAAVAGVPTATAEVCPRSRAPSQLEAYREQAREFTLKRDKAKHSKEALTGLRDTVLRCVRPCSTPPHVLA